MCAKSCVFHPARSSGALGNGWLGAVDGVFVSMVVRRRSSIHARLFPTLRIRHWTAPCHLCRERLIHTTSNEQAPRAVAPVVCYFPRAPDIAAALPRCPVTRQSSH